MNKKIFGILIITLFILCTLTTTASSINSTNTEKTNEILPANFEAPIQPIVETEQIDGRTWKIKVYAYNTLDEEVSINTMPDMVNTVIDYALRPYWGRVYASYGPEKKFFLTAICARLNIYHHTKNFLAHDKILIDEYTFEGKTNQPLWVRLYTRMPWRLPDGSYEIGLGMWYKYNGEHTYIGNNTIAYITLES